MAFTPKPPQNVAVTTGDSEAGVIFRLRTLLSRYDAHLDDALDALDAADKTRMQTPDLVARGKARRAAQVALRQARTEIPA